MNTCEHKVNPKHCRACKIARQKANHKIQSLTLEQVHNWRQYIATTPIGPWAWLMPTNDVLRFAQRMQEELNKMIAESPLLNELMEGEQ